MRATIWIDDPTFKEDAFHSSRRLTEKLLDAIDTVLPDADVRIEMMS